MYHNKNNSTYQQFNKGLRGESLFEEWCAVHSFLFLKSDKEEDYVKKYDYKIEGYTIDVKNNYNPRYDTVIVEVEQLVEGCPDAWINHDVNFIAWIIDDEVYITYTTDVRSIVNNDEFFMFTRYQSHSKGGYKLVAVPIEEIKKISLSVETLKSLWQCSEHE